MVVLSYQISGSGPSVSIDFYLFFPFLLTLYSVLVKWVLKTYSDHEIKREEIFSPPKQQRLEEKRQCFFYFKKGMLNDEYRFLLG